MENLESLTSNSSLLPGTAVPLADQLNPSSQLAIPVPNPNLAPAPVTINITPLSSQPYQQASLTISNSPTNLTTEPAINQIVGTPGRDNLMGTDGRDRLTGGQGADNLTGGLGADIFVYESLRDAGDTIKDFTIGEDKIDLTVVLQSVGYNKFDPLGDGYIYLSPYSGGTIVLLDSDAPGNLTARPYIYVQPVTPAQLTASDFLPNPGKAPEITANLVNDTGISDSDRLTYDPRIEGQISYSSPLTSVKAQLNSSAVEILPLIQAEGKFQLNTAQLTQINAGNLPDGNYSLKLTAQDNKGNISAIYSYDFSLDRLAPNLSLNLAPNFDSDPVGDLKTTFETVILVGTTEANLTVILGGLKATANGLGEFSFSNQLLNLGNNNFSVSATDLAGNVGTFSQNIERLAVGINQAPTGLILSKDTIAENSGNNSLIGTLSTLDPDVGDSHNYSLVTGQGDTDNSALTIVGNELRIKNSPDFETKSSYSIRVRTTDVGGLSYDQILTVKISNVNESPVADADKSITVQQGSLPVGLAINPPVDMDGDPLIIRITQLPDNTKGVIRKPDGSLVNLNDTLKIGELTALTYTTLADVNGNGGNFVYTASDGKGGIDSQTISFVINPSKLIVSAVPSNNAPEFTTNPELEIIVGNDYSYDANAVDGDNDTLFYSLSLAPDGLTIDNNTGILSWKSPTIGKYNISISVEDGKGGRDTQTYNLGVVTNVIDSQLNRPPVFVSNPVVYGNLNSEYRYDADATDADNDNLTYSVINAPNGLVINQNTGVVTFTPTVSGATEITLQVNDGKGGIATQIYTLSVLEEETDNYAPVIISEPLTRATKKLTQGESEVIDLSTWSRVQYELNSQSDANWILSSDNTKVEQTINADASILLSDFNLNSDRIEGSWRVNTSNDDDFMGFVFGYQDSQHFYLFDWKQSNQDDSLGFAEQGMSIKVVNADSALTGRDFWSTIGNEDRVKTIFHNTVSWSDFVDYQFSLDFTPGEFTITVSQGDTILESVTIEDDTYTSGQFGFYNYSQGNVIYQGFTQSEIFSGEYSYDVEAIDPDKDILTYSLVNAPQGMSIDNLTGEILWNTAGKTVGDYNVSVKVTDNRGGVDTQEFVIALNNALLGTIEGVKWEDINGNGIRDARNDTINLTVRGTDVIFLAGRNDVSIPPIGSNNSTFPLSRHSVVRSGFFQETFPEELVANTGDVFTFDSSGKIDFFNGTGQFFNSDGSNPDGSNLFKLAGVSGYQGPEGALVGVFLNNNNPANSNAPSTLNFTSSGLGLDFTALNPELGQVFFIGNGTTGTEQRQQFIAPKGATRLFLGIADGFDFDGQPGAYEDNDGAYQVRINRQTNEPGLAGVNVYLDANNNGVLDPNEPTQLTAADNPNTTNVDETGQYKFTRLEAGTYIVREIVPTDYEQTYPQSGKKIVNIDFDDLVAVINTSNILENKGVLISSVNLGGEVVVDGSITLSDQTNSFQILNFSQFSSPPNGVISSLGGVSDILLEFTNSVTAVSLITDLTIGDPGKDIVRLIALEKTIGNQFKVLSVDEKFDNTEIIAESTLSIDLGRKTFSYALFEVTTELEGFDNLNFTFANTQNYYTVELTTGEVVSNINFGNKKIDKPIPNQAPVFTSTAPQNAQIGQLLTYQATATDANNDRLTYSLLNQPEGMAVDAETGILIWQPKQNQIGNNRVVLRVSDGKGGIATQEFFLNTKGINTPPQIISSPNTLTLINNTYSYEVKASDFDNDTLTYSLINPPEGMTINANTGLIAYTPTKLGKQTIEIKVSDGFGGTNTQSYQLQILATLGNNLPSITSTPKIIIGAGGLYQYDVEANDPENTAISYNLTVKPNGMNIDANTGLITWQTQAVTNGDFQVTVTATDADGGIAYQNYYIRVTPNQAPIISSQPLELAQLGVTYKYDVIAKDADNDTLTYNLLQAPQGLTIDQFGRIRWQSSSQNQGIYPVKIQVGDGRGGITTQTYNLTLSNNDITNPVVELGFNTNLINIGESINFQVRATDNIEVKTLTLTANKTPLTLNPNTPNGQINTATFVGQKAGVYQIIATATDAAGNQDTETIEVRVLDPSDTKAPVIEINKTNLEATQGIIKSPTDIIATVTDDNLEFYRVEIAPIEAVNLSNIGEDDPDYTLLTKGTKNVTNQQVASLDPRLLANGSYLVKITAFDFSGNGNVQGVILNVTGQNKPGEFSLEYTDLSIPLTGVPIEIIRRYNSLKSASQGDFGYGWDLGLQDAKIIESSPDGRDLSEANSDLFGTSNTFSVGTRVTLNTPDGRRVGFTFNPVPVSASFFGAIYAPSFTPDAGVFDKLETENFPLTIRSNGTVGAFLFSFVGYNPSQYKLTTKDGTVYKYDQKFGLIDVTDRNGNKLSFSDEGIISSTGAEIDFIRDAQGRITEIIDPDGKSIKYVYDSKGDLIKVIDRTNNTTELVYDDPNRQHFLTEIIDPLGRSATRTEYDENGQISKIIDANGNELNIAFNNATNSQTIKDPFGKTITRVFDAQGNVIQEVDQLGGITLRTYDANNKLTSETDPEGNITSYTYDNRGNKLTETDGEGNKKTFTYNESNDILTETTALGFVTTYTYDNKGNLTKRKDTEGNVTEYKYDSLGLLTAVTDANGKISNFKYDNRGNLTELTDPTGAKTTFTYDSNGRVASVTDALGAITNYIYDAQGRLIEKADPEGSSCGCARGITKTEYNAAGEKIAEIDALGRRTEYRYNDRGLLIETILPDSTPTNLSDNPRTKNEYDALDRLTGFTDELGRKTIYVYDALGREIEVIYPDSTPNNLTDNPRTKKEYDKAGRVIAKIDELGNRTEYDYDKSDRLLTVTNALNQITSYNYDADGRKVAMTDALGRITKYDYDELDRLLTTTYANNAVMTTTYDPLGRVIAEKDLAGNTTNYEYDALGRLTAVIDALNQRTEYKYDLVGNLIEQKDANGNITKFEYDSLRRLKATILPGGQRNETINDKIGNLIKVTDFNGVVTTYKYNERNWLTEKSFSDSTPTETFTYTLTGELATVIDNRGVTNYVYDERDRLISRTEPDNRTISYTYDKASNILTLTVPSGTTTYTYDALNRLDTVKDADNGVTDYDYDAVGNLIKTVFPNGVTENQQYDLLNRLTYLENRNSTGIISSYTYTLDAMGNRVKVVENDGRTVEYNYDNLYRLTQEKITDTVAGNKTITYVFDAVGNRLQKIDSVEGTTTYTYNENDRLLKEILGGNVTQYQYDEEGNLLAKVENGATTTNYEWNAKGELTAVEVTENGKTGRIEFEYDHNGIRVAIDVDGEVTRFLIDNNQQQYAQVIEEYQTNGIVNTTYTHGWDLISQDDGANRIYYQVDGLGSTRLMTGNNGSVIVEYDYDAYGNLTRKVGDADNNYLFAGEQFDDAVDGYYLRARYYDPNTGRFASVDPFEGYNNQPITLHDYLYAGVNPVNAIDPSGEVTAIEYAVLVGAISGAILAPTFDIICKLSLGEGNEITVERELKKFVVGSLLGASIGGILAYVSLNLAVYSLFLESSFFSNLLLRQALNTFANTQTLIKVPKLGLAFLGGKIFVLQNCDFVEFVAGGF